MEEVKVDNHSENPTEGGDLLQVQVAPPPNIPAISRFHAVQVARSWIDTPYRLGARVRGAGCDCATLLAEYAIECGIAPREDLGMYSHDWFCNTSEERYKFRMLRYARRAIEGICRGSAEALPGSFVLFKVARSPLFNHGGIVTSWPYIVHAIHPRVTESDATRHCMTSFTEMCIFDPWG